MAEPGTEALEPATLLGTPYAAPSRVQLPFEAALVHHSGWMYGVRTTQYSTTRLRILRTVCAVRNTVRPYVYVLRMYGALCTSMCIRPSYDTQRIGVALLNFQ